MKNISLIMIIFLSSVLAVSAGETDYADQAQAGKWLRNVIVSTEFLGETSSAKIQIYFPTVWSKGKKLRTVIALHQYNNTEKDWENGASIQNYANKYNMVIVCPRMDNTLYETSYYPETKYKWNVIPGGKFIGETLIKFLNDNFSLALKKQSTGIMGVTVGAHGALVVACHYPDKFSVAAGIAGYYDASVMQTSKMIESVYGSYKNFQDRWENDDNPLKLADRLKNVNVYLYHGLRTDAFQPGQSQILAIKLKQLQNKDPEYSITYRDSKTGFYGWTWWKGQIAELMEFMDEKLTD